MERRYGPMVATLGGLSGLAPLGIDMYVPGLPELTGSFGTTQPAAQATITAFLFGQVVGQLVLGPLSDTVGRRSLLLAGPATSTAFSLLCAVAPTIEVFTVARFLAAFCAASGMVLARAVAADLFEGPQLARLLAMIGIVLGVAPVAAPTIGGLVLQVAGWRAVFVVLAAVGLVLTACVWRWVPESLPVPRRGAGRGTFRVLCGFLRSRVLLGYLLALGFTSAAMFTYISDSSFVFQTTYGLGTGIFSLVFASNAVAMLLAGGAFGAFADRVRPRTMLVAGIGTLLLATAVHAVLVVLTGGNVVVSWICLAVAMAGTGLVLPAIMTIGQTIGSHAPGAMSALLGTSQFLLGALVAPLAGLSGAGPLPMVLIMFGAAALACVALASARSRSRQETS